MIIIGKISERINNFLSLKTIFFLKNSEILTKKTGEYMKIGNKQTKKTKNTFSKGYKVFIVILSIVAIFFSGALFQQRGLDISLVRSIFELRAIINNELNLFRNNGLSTIYLDIPFSSFEKITQKRNEALKTGILLSSDEDLVKAKIHIDDEKEVEIDIRLKGDWTDHLASNKWSYRIHVKNGEQVLGTKRFSLQAPETRNFLAEWAFHQHCFQEDILTTKYTFVNVVENGVYKGIYAFEESFSEEMLENQGKREGVILKLDEQIYWTNRSDYFKLGLYDVAVENNFLNITNSYTATNPDVFRQSHLINDPLLSQQKEYALGLMNEYLNGNLPAKSVFDLEKFGKYYAIIDFWAANHATHWVNMRFYFNPITGLIEPVAFDGQPLTQWTNFDMLGFNFDDFSLFKNPEVREHYYHELVKLTKEEHYINFKNSIMDQSEHFQKALNSEYLSLESFWNILDDRRKMLSVLIDPQHPVRGSYSVITDDLNQNSLELVIKNLTIFPVEVITININEVSLPFSEDMINESLSNNWITLDKTKYINFNEHFKEFSTPEALLMVKNKINKHESIEKVSINVRIIGSNQTREVILFNIPNKDQLALQQPQIQLPSMDEVSIQHSFLEVDLSGNFIVPPGTWAVDGDLILPKNTNLIFKAGAHLLFEKDSLLYLEGGSLNIFGSADNYSSLSSIDEPWAGIILIDSQEDSHWQFAEISQIKGFDREGWMVTGGITFYQSNVKIANSIISDSFAEDAINIIHSNFFFDNLSVINTISDAFDGDYVDGNIANSSFNQISGDAVDISGSTIDITNCYFEVINDKAVSAGEHSIVIANNLNISKANIGVASKDLSKVYISDSVIYDTMYVALTVFQKKAIYGPASMEAYNMTINTPEKVALVQTNSSLNLENELIEEQDFDVKTLYDLGILGN